MSDRACPTTRATAVSDSSAPILHPGRRVRSLGAALAGGSPQSSPTPSSVAELSPLGRPATEIRSDSLTDFPFQHASSQGNPLPSTSAGTSGGPRAHSLPLGATLEALDAGASPPLSPINDVPMESATERELRQTLQDIRARLPLALGKVERAVDEAKAKIDAATLDGAVAAALPTQFQSDVREFLRGYRAQVETLASAQSTLAKLRKHRHAQTFPTSMNSIKAPAIQFSRAFVNAPADEGVRGSYNLTPGATNAVFETAVEKAVTALKKEVLAQWVTEKDKEVSFLERKASAATAVTEFEEVVKKKHEQLKARWDYLQSSHAYDSVIRDVDSYAAISHALAMTIITKVNSLVLDEEDKRLALAVKKMDLAKPAKKAASQANSNKPSELKKMVANLTKQVGLLSKKVSDHLYCLLCVCAGHLTLTRPLLESLIVDIVREGWEEVGCERQGEEREGRRNRKTKGQEGPSRRGREVQGQRQGQGWRPRCQVKAARQQEEGWQEVGASLGLSFQTDSAPVSFSGLYEFSDLYGLDWALLSGLCRFLCLSFPPSVLMDSCLVPVVCLCCVIYSLLHAAPKFNIFDYTTYPDLVVRMEQDLAFMVLS